MLSLVVQLLTCPAARGSAAYLRMNNSLGGFCLVALLAAGCHSSPAPGDTTGLLPPMAQPAAPASPSLRAQAMRLHDAAMNRLDSLYSERERLTGRLAAASQPQAARLRRTIGALQAADQQMMGWMHQLREPDSTRQPRAQLDAFWQQQIPQLRRLDQLAKAALDSAQAVR